jgi:hypothetical protein
MKVRGTHPKVAPSTCPDCGRAVVVAVTSSGEKKTMELDPALPGFGTHVLFFEVDGLGNVVEPALQRVTPADRSTGFHPAWVPHAPACEGRWRARPVSQVRR